MVIKEQPIVNLVILFYPGASRATGSPRRERTIRGRPAGTKGESPVPVKLMQFTSPRGLTSAAKFNQ